MTGVATGRVDSAWAARLRRELKAAPELAEATSRFGSPGRLAWRCGTKEVAHLHAKPLVDIRLPKKARAEFAADPRLLPRATRSDWIECRMESADDAVFVADLIRRAAKEAGRR